MSFTEPKTYQSLISSAEICLDQRGEILSMLERKNYCQC